MTQLMALTQASGRLFASVQASNIQVIARRTAYKKFFNYENNYKGRFDYHDLDKYPRSMARSKEEELLDEVQQLKALTIDEPSPFHVVRRVRSMNRQQWDVKVALRRLNLHSSFNGECVIVPNSPQYNSLIKKVKHLVQLKPAKFENGQIPTQKDIGAVKVCPSTGKIIIDEKLRLQANRLKLEKPLLFRGNHLRSMINKSYGLCDNNPIKPMAPVV